MCSVLACAAESAPAPIPVRDFSRWDQYQGLVLSPTGQYLAVQLRGDDGGTVLAIVNLADNQLVASAKTIPRQQIIKVSWVRDDQLVYSLAESQGPFDSPRSTGELFGLKVGGSGSRYLFGYRGEMSTGTLINKTHAEEASGYVVSRLRNDPSNVLIAVYPWNTLEPSASLYKMSVTTGAKSRVGSAPGKGWTNFLTDASGFVRYAVGRYTNLMAIDTFVRSESQPDWQAVNVGQLASANVSAVSFSTERNTAYLISDEQNRRNCLIAHRLTDNRREALACHEIASVQDYSLSHDGSTPIGVGFEPGKAELKILDEHEDARVLRMLTKAFPGYGVQITSWSDDGKKAVARVWDDRTPGEFFLFDRDTRKADHLFSARSWIDPEKMGERRPISFKSADGMTLYGYLTLPPGIAPSKLPLVVMPHGGPLTVRDGWAFDAEAQLLASRGYAVLQPNFRGSGGYGVDYIEAGTKQWGSGMIDDIAAGTKYVTDSGIADARRVCIYGVSYGGYAALMSAVRYPDLYRCTVGFAGAYDLPKQKRDSDVAETKLGRQYQDFFIGDEKADLDAQSPINHLDKLKAAVMIVHGESDERVPFSQAKLLRAALEKKGYPFEWLSYAGEGHGFYNEAHREEFCTRLLKFLDQHIGQKAVAAMP
ncbi:MULTISPECIES: alpha/beta hydrolase family protein [Hydrocarboniphaga]|jgi:dipeptidyl aminopeptidase/acylaminoacyl peptidase|uniref:Peptidase S9 prolyl oligopeptidase catalytic domain-containing protein n=1 Tax=Hydrocarboniphaga effusa AP103 TaxID=1172194 RepID=I7ZJQ7_9GAMM|nr:MULTISPECIES: S9 family peptidase [Hydrocarboniphaga]EIT72169.1 hypothetical protein WQQ_23060 [Hydrocarboniphaga effusa AP103]MDZ4079693.1 S9 family peptidase [Hydrocarboniphaga sp.]